MNTQSHDWPRLDEHATVSQSDLLKACGLCVQEMEELIEYGAIVPLALEQGEPCFSAECVIPLREAVKLRVVFDLDIFTVVLLMEGLQRIEALTHRVRTLESMVSRRERVMMTMQEPIDVGVSTRVPRTLHETRQSR